MPATLTQTNKTPSRVPSSVPKMNRLQQRKLTRQERDSNPNAHLLCKAKPGSLLTYRAIRARVRERDIRERDIGQRDIGQRNIQVRNIQERAIGETVATCRFAK